MPTLGEIASYQESLLKGIPESGQSIKNINSWMDFYKKRDDLEKGRRDLETDAFTKQTAVVTRMIGNPAWQSGDLKGINDALDSAEKDAKQQRIPVNPDGPLARVRKKVNAGDIPGGYQDLSDLVRQNLSYSDKGTAVIPNPTKANPPGNSNNVTPPVNTPPGNTTAPTTTAPVAPGATQQQQPTFTFRPGREKPDVNIAASLKETPDETLAGTTFGKKRIGLQTAQDSSVPLLANIDNVLKTADNWIAEGEKLGIIQPLFGDKAAGMAKDAYKWVTGNDPNMQAGLYGTAKRKLANTLGLDPDYQEQIKNLATVTQAQSAALGGQTDAGRALTEATTGKVTVDPWVLKKIAEQAKADQIHINYKAEAAGKFAERYGNREGGGFDRMWNANADRKVFQAFNVMENPNFSIDEKKKRITELWGKPGSDEYNKNQRKATNIDLLVTHGSL